MAKDDSKTRLLDAGRSLLADGVELGVNAVAKRSGLNKVLLYRYFGDWNGYLVQLSAGLNLWKGIRMELMEGLKVGRWGEVSQAAAWILGTYVERLRRDPVVVTIMATEQIRSSPLLQSLDAERETEGLGILEALWDRWPEVPRNSSLILSTILSAGLSHLVLRSRQVQTFNALDLSKEETWSSVVQQLEAVLRSLEPNPDQAPARP